MNALVRFWQRGADDADRRVAMAFARPEVAAADRYLMSSSVVRAFDRFTVHLQSLISSSRTGRAFTLVHDAWQREGWNARYQTIGLVLIVATAVHLAATLMQGQPPDGYRLIVPALAAAFAVLLLIASRSTHAPD